MSGCWVKGGCGCAQSLRVCAGCPHARRSLLADCLSVRLPLNATRAFPPADDVRAAARSAAGRHGAAAAASAVCPGEPNLADALPAIRAYLAAARDEAYGDYGMDDVMPSVLESYFVAQRAAAPGQAQGAQGGGGADGFSPEDFHMQLSVSCGPMK